MLYTTQNLGIDFSIICKCFSNSRLSSFRTRRSFHCFSCFWPHSFIFNLHIYLFHLISILFAFFWKTMYLFPFFFFFWCPLPESCLFKAWVPKFPNENVNLHKLHLACIINNNPDLIFKFTVGEPTLLKISFFNFLELTIFFLLVVHKLYITFVKYFTQTTTRQKEKSPYNKTYTGYIMQAATRETNYRDFVGKICLNLCWWTVAIQ